MTANEASVQKAIGGFKSSFLITLFLLGLPGLLTGESSAAPAVVPVIPGASGFGINTPAGRGGTVYKVTSLASSDAPGTLRHAINQTGPRVVVFEVSGTIRVDGWIEIANPYITIAGQTAPSPGIFLRGAVLNVGTHDVLIQHLRIAPGDDPQGVESETRDCLSIAHATVMPTNIVIDHCTLTWSVDEAFSTWYPVGELTFRNLLVAESLHNSIHQENGVLEAHGFGPLFYHNAQSKITMTGNLISHCASRMPASGSGHLVMVNNLIYDKIDFMTSLFNRDGVHSKNSLVGNVFIYGASCAAWSRKHKPIQVVNDILAQTRLYVADNYSPDFPINDPWDLVDCPSHVAGLKAAEPPVWNEGLKAKPAREVVKWVTKNAGARPADRLPYETRIINNAKNGTGKYVNSISEAGGWPVVAENRRPLAVPNHPDSDDDGDGYTNLEEWLHKHAAAVAGEGKGEQVK